MLRMRSSMSSPQSLTDAGEIETADRVHHMSPPGASGWMDMEETLLESDGVLSLIIADFSQSQEIATLTATDMNAIIQAAVTTSSNGRWMQAFRRQLGGVSPGIRTGGPHRGKRWPAVPPGCDYSS